MRRIALPLLLLSSALALCAAAQAATRPRYGGTLRVLMQEGASTLDPGASPSDAGARVSSLVFDTLVALNDTGTPQASLARTWTSDAALRRWQFWLRPGVKFHDGEALTADTAAASLANAIAGCAPHASGDSVIFECEAPQPSLPARLASPAAAIVRRAGGKLLGTGPFTIEQFEPGRRAMLRAFDDAWSGRPYLDGIDFLMGQDYREQALALDAGRADVIELPGTTREGMRASSPCELVALAFSPASQAVADERVRQAVSFALDRNTIASVLLQYTAVPANAILPQWLSGYSFLFAQAQDLGRARQLSSEARAASFTLAPQSNDPQLRLIAERIALNARDAGFNVQFTADPQRADAVLVHVPLGSSDSEAALVNVAAALHRPSPEFRDASLDSAYHVEHGLLAGSWIVPVVHASRAWALSPRVRNWAARRDGQWRLADVWLDPGAAARAAGERGGTQ